MSKVAVKIDRMRSVQLNGLVAFFDFTIGIQLDNGDYTPLLKVRDNGLRQSTSGDGYWVTFPSKPRMKDGAQVMNPSGKPQYDDIVSAVLEESNGQWAATEPSKKFKSYIEQLATAKYNEVVSSEGGRGAPAAAPARRTAAPTPRQAAPVNRSRAAVQPQLAGGDEGDEGDDFAGFNF